MNRYQESMSIKTIIDQFLQQLITLGYAKSTVQSYRKDLYIFAQYIKHFDDIFSVVKIEMYINYGKYSGKQVSSSYRNRKLSCLRSFFRYLSEQGLLPDGMNPTSKIRFAKLSHKEPSTLSYDEYKKIINIIRRDDNNWLKRRDLAIVATLYNTGLRLSELVSLDIEQFDIEGSRFIEIRRKGGDIRDLPINHNVVLAVKSWLNFHPNYSSEPDSPIFVSRLNKRISPRTVELMISKYSQKALISKRVTPHTFRHSHCTEIQRRGTEARTAQKIMGHQSIETTMRYSHSEEEDIRRAVSKLDDPEFHHFFVTK